MKKICKHMCKERVLAHTHTNTNSLSVKKVTDQLELNTITWKTV